MTTDPAFTGERPLLPALTPHLEKGERVYWAGRPDVFSLIRTQKVLWLIGGAVLAAAVYALFMNWIGGEVFMPIALVGVAFLAGPLLNLFEDDRTVYAVTNRRALIVHNGMKPHVVSTPFSEMDEKFEVLETGYGAGHVYFASGQSTKLRDVDYTGKLAFRNVLLAQHVARMLDAARKR
jgi:hypothetical protein